LHWERYSRCRLNEYQWNILRRCNSVLLCLGVRPSCGIVDFRCVVYVVEGVCLFIEVLGKFGRVSVTSKCLFVFVDSVVSAKCNSDVSVSE
jgi:hypothetical protein